MPKRLKKNASKKPKRRVATNPNPRDPFSSTYKSAVGVRMDKPSNTQVALSKCALKYAVACSDPFDTIARGACVPIGTAPTQKVTAFSRITMDIGANGFGYVFVTPSLANDMPSVFFTDQNFSGNSVFTTGASLGAAGVASVKGTGWVSMSHNGPYKADDILPGVAGSEFTGDGVSGRIVCSGIRVTYIGTTLNQSGLIHCYHEPSHDSLSGARASDLGRFADTAIEAVTREPCTLTMLAVSSEEMNFSNDFPGSTVGNYANALYPYCNNNRTWSTTYNGGTYYVGGVGSNNNPTFILPIGAPIGAISVSGVPGMQFQVEYITHMEFEGPLAAASLSSNTPDVVGANMVRSAALAIPGKKMANPKADLWGLMVRGLKELAREAIPIVVPMAKATLMSLL